MDLYMNHELAKQMVKDEGWDGFFKHFDEEYPNYSLYSCSQFWYNDDHYICKLKGGRGDLIIGWEGVHDK